MGLFIAFGSNCLAAEFSGNSLPITTSMKNFFEARGITVSDHATLRITQIKNSSNAAPDKSEFALCLTQYNNGIQRTDYYLFYGQNKNGEVILLNPLSVLNDLEFSYDYPPSSWEDRYVIHATAEYTNYNNGFVRPLSLSWNYELFDMDTDISYIGVGYLCDGILCSYPDYEEIDMYYTHTIAHSQYLPVPNRTYSAPSSSMLISIRAIDISGSGMNPDSLLFPGQYLVFEVTINGLNHTYQVGF